MLIKLGKRIFPIYILCIVLILTAECTSAVTTVNAGQPEESAMRLEKLYIQLLPEYDQPRYWDADQPSLLVSYSGEFVNYTDKEFFDYLYMPVPDESSMFTMDMVCETEKGMLYLPYEVVDGYVRWKPTKPVDSMQKYLFIVEYYCNPITVANGGIKDFMFQFARSGLISEVHLDIFMPNFSSDYVFTPAAKRHTVINNGIDVYSYEYTNVSEQTPIMLAVQYYKADHQPTGLDAEGTVPSVYTTPRLQYIGVIIFALILLIMGVSVVTLTPKMGGRRGYLYRYPQEKEDRPLSDQEQRKKNLRRLLIDGKIDEQTYLSLLHEDGTATQK